MRRNKTMERLLIALAALMVLACDNAEQDALKLELEKAHSQYRKNIVPSEETHPPPRPLLHYSNIVHEKSNRIFRPVVLSQPICLTHLDPFCRPLKRGYKRSLVVNHLNLHSQRAINVLLVQPWKVEE